MKPAPVRVFVALIFMAFVGVACGGGGGETAPTPQGTPQTPAGSPPTSPASPAPQSGALTFNGQKANDHGSRSVVGEDSEDVELDNYYFSPTTLNGSPGQSFTVRLKNEGSVPHTFTIDAQNVDKELQPDDETTVQVTFPQSGRVIFYCRFHAGLGMFGALSA